MFHLITKMMRTERTHLRKMDLAPSENISSSSYTKSMGLPLYPSTAAPAEQLDSSCSEQPMLVPPAPPAFP